MNKEKTIESSIIRSLFNGKIEEDLIFPYPSLNKDDKETLDLFLDSLRKFAKEKIDAAKIDAEEKIPDEVLDGLKQLGVFGLVIPTEYGGFGFPMHSYCRATEELSSICASTAITIGAHQSIGMKAIILFGNEEQKKKFLPQLATGEKIAAYALTEPEAGSDAQSIKTKAVLDSSGKNYILNGSKQWITNGGIADIFTVFAKTEVEEEGKKKLKITAFIVPKETSGFTVGKKEEKMGIRGSVTNPLFFENALVPKENILGDVGRGFKVAMDVLNEGRLSLAAGCVGACKKLINMGIEHAKTRKQFDKYLHEMELIKDKISDCLSDTFAAESMVYLTAGLADRGVKDFSLEAAACKIFASETLWKVVNHVVQINGGNGYMREYPYERMLRDSRINMIFEGTNEILRVYLSLAGIRDKSIYLSRLGKSLKNPLAGLGTISQYLINKTFSSFKEPSLKKQHPALNSQGKCLAHCVKKLENNVEKLLFKYGKKIMEKEFIQKRLSDVVVDLYAMLSVISRLSTIIKQNGIEKTEAEINLGKLFISSACRRIQKKMKFFTGTHDILISRISDEAVNREGYKYG